jgi:cytochrome c
VNTLRNGFLAGLTLAAALLPASASADAARGQALVQKNCGMCHAVGRTGASPNAAAPAFRDLHLRYPVDSLAEALAEGILTGHPQMPEFRFAPEEVNDIILYLKSIQTEQGASLTSPGTRSAP